MIKINILKIKDWKNNNEFNLKIKSWEHGIVGLGDSNPKAKLHITKAGNVGIGTPSTPYELNIYSKKTGISEQNVGFKSIEQ